MKKLEVYTGGHLFRNEDFDFIQDAYQEGFKALIEGFAKQNDGFMILSGCEVVKNQQASTASIDVYNVTEGYICYDYEIVYCPAQTVNVAPGSLLQYETITTNILTGTRTYLNNAVKDCHKDNSIVVSGANGSGRQLPIPNLSQSLGQLLSQQPILNIFVALQNGWSYQSNKPQYFQYLRQLQQKALIAHLSVSQNFLNAQASPDAPYSEIVALLPQANSPIVNVEVWVNCSSTVILNSGTTYKANPVLLTINTLGEVILTKIDDSQNKTDVNINVSYL